VIGSKLTRGEGEEGSRTRRRLGECRITRRCGETGIKKRRKKNKKTG
jgi:hypothetical protein